MWSFRKTLKAPWENEDMLLTDEEADECQRFIRSIAVTEEGRLAVPNEIVDSFQRVLIAFCLMGRVDRFLILVGFWPVASGIGDGDPSGPDYEENVAKAIETSAKACAIYPISIILYDFASILRAVGYKEESKATFAEFLRRYNTIPIKPHEELLFAGHDIDNAVRDATNEISENLGDIRDVESPF